MGKEKMENLVRGKKQGICMISATNGLVAETAWNQGADVIVADYEDYRCMLGFSTKSTQYSDKINETVFRMKKRLLTVPREIPILARLNARNDMENPEYLLKKMNSLGYDGILTMRTHDEAIEEKELIGAANKNGIYIVATVCDFGQIETLQDADAYMVCSNDMEEIRRISQKIKILDKPFFIEISGTGIGNLPGACGLFFGGIFNTAENHAVFKAGLEKYMTLKVS